MKLLYTSLTLLIILMMTFIITSTISKKSKLSREKNSPFECGFSSMNSARKPFSTHFFMIAMMFLIFDIEISIILPMYSMKTITPKEWMEMSSIILIILLMGLYHEWNHGMLEWSK